MVPDLRSSRGESATSILHSQFMSWERAGETGLSNADNDSVDGRIS